MNKPVSRGYGAILCLYFLVIVVVALPLEQAGAYTVENQTSATVIRVTVTDGNPLSTRTWNLDAGIKEGCPYNDTVSCNNNGEKTTILTALVTISAHGGFKCKMRLTAEGTLIVREKKRPWLNPNYPNEQGYPVDYECESDIGAAKKSFSLKNRGFDGDRANRDVHFLATGDPQFQNEIDDAKKGMNQNSSRTIFQMSCYIRWVPGCDLVAVSPNMRGIIIAGDLVENGGSGPTIGESEFDKYSYALKTINNLDHYYYDGMGNHDYHPYFPYQRILQNHVSLRPRGTSRTYYDPRKDGCVDGFGSPARCGPPPLTERPHYSWDWDDVHFVQLNLYPGNGVDTSRQSWEKCADVIILGRVCAAMDPYNSLDFLETDLANFVGDSNRPVVLIHHYGVGPKSDVRDPNTALYEWTPGQKLAYWNAIAKYNVVAIITGHFHIGAQDPNWYGEWKRPDNAFGKGIERVDRPPFIYFYNAAAARSANAPINGAYIDVSVGPNTVEIVRKNNATGSAARDSSGSTANFVLSRKITYSLPPAINCGSSNEGWYADNQTVQCDVSEYVELVCDNAMTCSTDKKTATFSLWTQVPVGIETDNAETMSKSVCDVYDECATGGPIAYKIDRKSPVITPPVDVTVEATGPLSTPDIGTATAADGGSGVATITDDAGAGIPANTTTTVTWTATDNVGNMATATQQVTVVDTTPPVVTAPPDTSVEAYTFVEDFALATAMDAVGAVEIKSNPGIYYFPEGETIVTWTAVDAAGNVGTATQRVTATKSGGGAFGLGELLLLTLFGAAGLRRSPRYRH